MTKGGSQAKEEGGMGRAGGGGGKDVGEPRKKGRIIGVCRRDGEKE